MDKSILLQKQIRDNSEDLQKEFRDMEAWEEQMKKKDLEMRFLKEDKVIPPIRTKKKKMPQSPADLYQNEKPNKTKRTGTDYQAWDAFDADNACREMEKNDRSNEKFEKVLEIPSEEQLKKEYAEATKLKDEGNALVQQQQYAKAISKYSEAIKIFPGDAAFYANRALCQLKLDNLYSADSDCTAAIKLNETYVKAYHRRATVRMELKRYKDAAEDLEKLLELEPSNKEAQLMLKQAQIKIQKSAKPLIISGNEEPEDNNVIKQIGEKLLNKTISPTSPTKPVTLNEQNESKNHKNKDAETDINKNKNPSIKEKVNKIFSDEELEKDHADANKFKDEGNALVQKHEYIKAIEKYSQAIKIFPYDSAYFANRALCQLKLDKFQDAESDCTFAIELDNRYIKAYLRRASARMEQNNYENALKDVKQVLKIVPSNKEAIYMSQHIQAKLKESSKVMENSGSAECESIKITHKHIDKQSKVQANTKIDNKVEPINDTLPAWLPKLKEGVDIVESSTEPSRSKQTLKRIVIKEISDNESIFRDIVEGENKDSFKQLISENEKTGHKDNDCESKSTIINHIDAYKNNVETITSLPPPPKSSVTFLLSWRKNISLDFRYLYLKQILPKDLPDIFKESMESNIFSEILLILNTMFISKEDKVYDYLYYLSKLKRFRALVLFMTQTDKEALKNLFEYCKTNEKRIDDEVNSLYAAYEM